MLTSRDAYQDFPWAASWRRWSLYDITKRGFTWCSPSLRSHGLTWIDSAY